MVKVFRVIGFKIVLSLSLLPPSHAAKEVIFDMRDEINIARSIAYKGKLEHTYSQIENWTDNDLIFKLTYILPGRFFQTLMKITVPDILIPAHHLLIFPMQEKYPIYSVAFNDNRVFVCYVQNQQPIYHINFFSQGPTRPIDATYNINIIPYNQPQ